MAEPLFLRRPIHAIRQRTLCLEPLEPRLVLDAGSPLGGVDAESWVVPASADSPIESILAQTVVVEPSGVTVGELYAEIPELTPEQQAILDAHEAGILPEMVVGDGPISISEVAPTLADGPILGPSGSGAGSDGTFQFYRNEPINVIPGGNSSNINEPSVGSTGRGVFQTGNWYASLSTDNGKNWQYVNPFTQFGGQTWGGFCCDQRVVHDDARDMTIWYLQYLSTGNTPNDTNGIKIAVARSEEDLLNNTWTSYDIAPSTFGYGTGEWFDFPHMQIADDFLYVTTNLFTTTTDAYVGNLMYRASLDDLKAGNPVSLPNWQPTQSWNDHTTIGLVTGASDTMYGASIVNGTTIRVFDIADSSSTLNSRTVGGLHTTFFGTHTSLTPSGKNWTGRADSRVQTGWVNSDTVGFMWNSAQGTSRPQPFVRAVWR